MSFWVKTVLLGQEVHYNMVYVSHYTELILQICNYAQKRQICRENSKCAPDENFVPKYAFAERLPTSVTLFLPKAEDRVR